MKIMNMAKSRTMLFWTMLAIEMFNEQHRMGQEQRTVLSITSGSVESLAFITKCCHFLVWCEIMRSETINRSRRILGEIDSL